MPPSVGKILVLIGLGLVVLGAVVWLGGGSLFSWFGRLPGDIRVERPGFRFYAPLASMLLLSLLLSLVLWLVRRLGS
ncbi:DUF2905 domain-containing protein [Hymenobacter chitinivorans]|uniref:DUF2905 family protein n=1 Tax=Hymenobacter chitinivorans DSM 11115 TaxID=1121954 RepID=A0A2M9BPG4_9BACT|nr:DUF2905 domain-containing protein [Hymenobacter chitinivorans]PJJ59812.1 Protein of unknown function (DUF2905) [Hymenobacter chitinivorans DSM 11115]